MRVRDLMNQSVFTVPEDKNLLYTFRSAEGL